MRQITAVWLTPRWAIIHHFWLPPHLFFFSSNPKMREETNHHSFWREESYSGGKAFISQNGPTREIFSFFFFFFHFSFSALWERERKFLHLKEHIAESFITTDVLCATRIMLWHGEWKEEKFRGLFSLPERERDDWFGSESFERELLTATPSVCKQVNFSTAVICVPVIYFLRLYYVAEW